MQTTVEMVTTDGKFHQTFLEYLKWGPLKWWATLFDHSRLGPSIKDKLKLNIQLKLIKLITTN